MSSTAARVAPGLLKTIAILSDTTIKRSEVDQENLKPYWESEERPYSTKPIIYKFLKDFTNPRKKTNKAVHFGC